MVLPAWNRSSSDIAAAIHSPPVEARASLTAVTSPPAPRVVTTRPDSPRAKDTGPRFEATTIRRPTGFMGAALVSASQGRQHPHVVLELAEGEEPLGDPLPSGPAHLGAELQVGEDMNDTIGAGLRRREEETGD